MIFGTGNPLLWYGADISVRKTGSCGTRLVFRGSRCADNYLLLIQESEHPERDLIVEDVFSIVLDHIAIFDVFNLFLSFLSPANLKGLSVNLKILDGGLQRIVLLLGPAVEDGLACVPCFRIFSRKDIRHIGIVQVEFVHLA